MSLHFLSAENIRKPLSGIIDSIIEQHIAHRLTDDFLILTPDEICAQDLRDFFLEDPRLHGILSGESILSLDRWVQKTCALLFPETRVAPPHILEALFRSLLFQDSSFNSSNLSVESLYLLICSFREELLHASSLQRFLEGFDPELAQNCVHWFSEYQRKIDENPYLKDFTWQCREILKNLKNRNILSKIQKVYYLGFLDFPPLLKTFSQSLEKQRPEISQVLLFQNPKDMDVQDYLSKTWEEALPHLFQFNTKDSESHHDASTEVLKVYTSPFDEASDVLNALVRETELSKNPNSLALFLPPQAFWNEYYLKQLSQLGLSRMAHPGKALSSFKFLRDLFPLSLEAALTQAQSQMAEEKEKFEQNSSSVEKNEQAEKIRALHQFKEVLDELDFYQSELPELKPYFPNLSEISSKLFFKSRQVSQSGVQIRSIFQAGLKEFKHSFMIQMNDSHLPASPDRFFNLSLPQFFKQSLHQKALFQHLQGSAPQTHFSYSRLSLQASEQSPSSLLSSFSEVAMAPSKPFAFLNLPDSDLKKRLQIELLRQADLLYQNPYGGLIKNPDLLKKLQASLSEKSFSASRLEDYALCPFRFFARSLLSLESEEEKSLEGNPLEQGRWLHELLEHFFKKNQESLEQAGSKAFLRENLRQSLKSEILHYGKKFLHEKDWVNPRLFQDFTGRALSTAEDLLETYWKQWDADKKEPLFFPRYFEVDFGFHSEPLSFQRQGYPPLKIRGKIDRIDISEDGKMMIYDYKTGDTTGLSNEIQSFKKLQLPLYILAARSMKDLRNHQEIGALALGLKDMSKNQGLIQKDYAKTHGIRANSKSVLSEEKWKSFWIQFEEKLLDYQVALLQGDFRTRPDPCQEFCDYRNICRYHDRKKA